MTSPERPKDTAQAGRVLPALDELVRAAHQWSLYGRDHPVTKQACHGAAETIVALMSGRDGFTLTVVDDGLLAEGDTLPDHPPLRQLHQGLRRRQIASITMRPGLTWDEIASLIGMLATPAEELADAGGARRTLAAARCEHIELADVDYSRFVPEWQAQWMSSVSGAQSTIHSSVQGLVSACLDVLGDRVAAGGEAAVSSDRSVPMPFPIPAAPAAAADADHDGPSLHQQLGTMPDVSPDDYIAVGLAWLIQASGEALLDSSPQVRKEWLEGVEQRIAGLELSLQARVFRAPRQTDSGTPDILAALAADRSPEEIADLIVARPAAVVGEPSGSLERILRRSLTDERKLLAVEPLLRARLMARDMSQDSYRNVVGLLLDQIATDLAMRVSGAVQWTRDFEDLSASPGGHVDQWPDLAETTSAAAVGKSRAKVLLATAPYDHDAPGYLELLGHIEQAVAERAAAKDPGCVLEIVDALAREANSGNPTRAPIARSSLRRLATREVAAVLKDALAGVARERRMELIAALGMMGKECVDILLAEAEKAEDPEVRALAVRCLGDAGERGAAALRQLLSQGPFDRVMFTVAALTEGRDERRLNLLAAGFDHRQPAVRIGLAERLRRVPGLVSEQLLIRASYDEDPDVQARAAESLGELRAQGAIHALSLMASKGPLHGRTLQARKAAVEALGKIGSPEGVPVLREVLRKRNLLFRQRAQELAALAAAALARIPGPEAEKVLAESRAGIRGADGRRGVSASSTAEQAVHGRPDHG